MGGVTMCGRYKIVSDAGLINQSAENLQGWSHRSWWSHIRQWGAAMFCILYRAAYTMSSRPCGITGGLMFWPRVTGGSQSPLPTPRTLQLNVTMAASIITINNGQPKGSVLSIRSKKGSVRKFLIRIALALRLPWQHPTRVCGLPVT